MQFRLVINLGSDEMQTGKDVYIAIADSLRQSRMMFQGSGAFPAGESQAIRDENGNTVGKWEVVDETACKRCGVPAAQH